MQIDQFFFGLIGVVVGVVMVIFARKIVGWFGTSATFERYLGSGGTYTGLRISGILIAIICFLLMVGLLDDVVLGFFKSFK
jgi:hypothetical protein